MASARQAIAPNSVRADDPTADRPDTPAGAVAPRLEGMRILALAGEFPPYPGGIGTYAYNMAAAASALGAEVTVFAPDYATPPTDDAAAPFRIVRFPGGMHLNRQLPAKILLARSAIRRAPYDLVHAMDWPFFIPLALSAKHHQRRVFTIHGSDANDMARRGKRAAVTLSRLFSRRAEIVANSAYTLGLLRRNFPSIRPKSLRYAHLGVSAFWRVPVARNDAERQALDLPVGKFIVLTVGRIVPRKGQLRVIEALSTLADEVKRKLFYLVVGQPVDPAYTERLDAAIAVSGVEARRVTGISNERLRRLYGNADVFCLVGQNVEDGTVEGFGLVYLEAGSQGLPSMASPVQAVGEVVLDGENGLLVPPDDLGAIAGTIARLMEDEALRARLACAAQARAALFSWERCAAVTYR